MVNAADVALDVAVSDQPFSPIPLSASSDLPVPDDDASQLSGVRGEILSQVKSLFDSFIQSLEARFSSIDSRFNQVISSAASNVITDTVVMLVIMSARMLLTISFQLPLQ